ncbi:MAG: ornithine--oxo-acid transaminase [Acidobacteria bacterium]|nr:ornithine--oxo-acid transaminase [Acidobacteriota bacterium]
MLHIELAEQYGAHNYHPLPVVISKAEGVWVWDIEGNRYLDMLSSYSALNQGHRHPKIVQAMKEQLDRVTLTSRAFHNDQMGSFMKLLCEVSQMDKALLMNSGAEAVETAIKAARKWGYRVKGVAKEKAEIIVCENNFHGRTTTIVGFSSEEQYKEDFGPFTPGFVTIKYGDADALAAQINENTVAFLFEPIQGEGGILLPQTGFLSEARRICSENRVLLIADEIQTGLGRTGKMFACEHEGVKPDILVVGKALGGGLYPVSGILASKEIMDLFRPGDHGSTFGGNPLACACGKAALEVLVNEHLPEHANELGEYFLTKLRNIDSPHVKEVRGKGLLIGLEINKESGPARPFCEALSKRGILAKETHEQVIRFAPPLVITREQIDWVLEQVQAVLLEK